MTHDDAAQLMCTYYDNECSDGEEQKLFFYLSQSEESRRLFHAMMSMQSTLKTKAVDGYPRELDDRLSSLMMKPKETSFMNRTITLSVPSALLSAFVVCLVSLVLFFMLSKPSSYQSAYEQQMPATSMNIPGVNHERLNPN